jgi:hypothetical protein
VLIWNSKTGSLLQALTSLGNDVCDLRI